MLSCHIFSNYFMIKSKMLSNKQKTKTLQEALMAESIYLYDMHYLLWTHLYRRNGTD